MRIVRVAWRSLVTFAVWKSCGVSVAVTVRGSWSSVEVVGCRGWAMTVSPPPGWPEALTSGFVSVCGLHGSVPPHRVSIVRVKIAAPRADDRGVLLSLGGPRPYPQCVGREANDYHVLWARGEPRYRRVCWARGESTVMCAGGKVDRLFGVRKSRCERRRVSCQVLWVVWVGVSCGVY